VPGVVNRISPNLHPSFDRKTIERSADRILSHDVSLFTTASHLSYLALAA
jgi:hypothetical protein